MPGFLTHFLAAHSLKNKLPSKEQALITAHERLFNLGAQGPDFFFYYFTGAFSKKTRGFGSVMHDSNFGPLIACMADYARENEGMDATAVFAYTIGLIMHYCLDSTAHPYVYARTFSKSSSVNKNSADHRGFETRIDIQSLKHFQGKRPGDYNQRELIEAGSGELCYAANALSRAILKMYGRDISPKAIRRAMGQMIIFTGLLQSKTGRRKRWMEVIEGLTVKEALISSMVHNEVVDDEEDCLNLKKTPWQAHWDGASLESYSFLELFEQAVEEGFRKANVMIGYVLGDTSREELLACLQNRSLTTGMDIEADSALGKDVG